MQVIQSANAHRLDLVLEAIRRFGATVEQAAYYGGLRPHALLAELQANPELQVEVAIARDSYRDSQNVA